MPELTSQQLFEMGVQHHHAGRLAEAQQLYRQVLAKQPRHLKAITYLGVICQRMGQLDAAADLMQQGVAIAPHSPEAQFNLAVVLQARGSLADSIAAYMKAIALRRNYPEARNNLGDALMTAGRIDEAIAAWRTALEQRPDYADAWSNLGTALRRTGELDGAIAAYCKAIALRPDIAEPHYNLGNALQDSGQLEAAIASYRRAIALRRDFPEAHNNLGNALKSNGKFAEAAAACRTAISLRPNYYEAYCNLGAIFEEGGQLDDGIAACQAAITLRPASAEALSNLGTLQKDTGQLDDAIISFRRAITMEPGLIKAVHNLLYTLTFHPAYSASSIAEELHRWNQRYVQPMQSLIRPHINNRDPSRQLRVGYVSPNLRDHVVGRNLLPLFSARDRRHLHVTCYSQVVAPDALTNQFKTHSDSWRNIAGLSDEQVAARVRDDQIDILVDVTLHMAGSRLLMFAQKPAPIQVTFAGYPGSTGLTTIDYRLSDPYLDPSDIDESIYSEKTIHLPDSFWCYDPLEDKELTASPLPALTNGFITMGCLNNFCKINDAVLQLWARVLRETQNSRLLLLAHQGSYRQHTVDVLQSHGIDSRRVEFVAPRPRRAYLELYHRIDMGLDTFPYNGHTTSLDSIWMGVPIVTLVGDTAVARAGWSQLSNIGLTELAGNTHDQFVQIAVDLAADIPRLQQLRAALRTRMELSPLMDGPKFAGGIEAAYRRMWQTWCNPS